MRKYLSKQYSKRPWRTPSPSTGGSSQKNLRSPFCLQPNPAHSSKINNENRDKYEREFKRPLRQGINCEVQDNDDHLVGKSNKWDLLNNGDGNNYSQIQVKINENEMNPYESYYIKSSTQTPPLPYNKGQAYLLHSNGNQGIKQMKNQQYGRRIQRNFGRPANVTAGNNLNNTKKGILSNRSTFKLKTENSQYSISKSRSSKNKIVSPIRTISRQKQKISVIQQNVNPNSQSDSKLYEKVNNNLTNEVKLKNGSQLLKNQNQNTYKTTNLHNCQNCQFIAQYNSNKFIEISKYNELMKSFKLAKQQANFYSEQIDILRAKITQMQNGKSVTEKQNKELKNQLQRYQIQVGNYKKEIAYLEKQADHNRRQRSKQKQKQQEIRNTQRQNQKPVSLIQMKPSQPALSAQCKPNNLASRCASCAGYKKSIQALAYSVQLRISQIGKKQQLNKQLISQLQKHEQDAKMFDKPKAVFKKMSTMINQINEQMMRQKMKNLNRKMGKLVGKD